MTEKQWRAEPKKFAAHVADGWLIEAGHAEIMAVSVCMRRTSVWSVNVDTCSLSKQKLNA